MRRISRFARSGLIPAEEADRHYVQVHYPFMQRLYAENPTIRRYYTNHAQAKYGPDGTFTQAPDAWRFVVVELLDGADELPPTWMPPEARAAIFDDHAKFLRDLVGFEVAATAEVDRLTGQTSLVKCLFEHGVPEGSSFQQCAVDYRQRVLPVLREAASTADGVRMLVSNQVARQFESGPIREPAQMFTGRYAPEPTVVSFDELYFDADAYVAEFFADSRVQQALSVATLMTRGYSVVERCGVDKR